MADTEHQTVLEWEISLGEFERRNVLLVTSTDLHGNIQFPGRDGNIALDETGFHITGPGGEHMVTYIFPEGPSEGQPVDAGLIEMLLSQADELRVATLDGNGQVISEIAFSLVSNGIETPEAADLELSDWDTGPKLLH